MNETTIITVYLAIGALFMVYNISKNFEDRPEMIHKVRQMVGMEPVWWWPLIAFLGLIALPFWPLLLVARIRYAMGKKADR